VRPDLFQRPCVQVHSHAEVGFRERTQRLNGVLCRNLVAPHAPDEERWFSVGVRLEGTIE
jgi:hypothetical protein